MLRLYLLRTLLPFSTLSFPPHRNHLEAQLWPMNQTSSFRENFTSVSSTILSGLNDNLLFSTPRKYSAKPVLLLKCLLNLQQVICGFKKPNES